MKKCPYCAEEIQNEAIYCRFCEKWLEDLEGPQKQMQTCPFCAEEIEVDSKKCIYCESELKVVDVKETEISINQPSYRREILFGLIIGGFILVMIISIRAYLGY